MTSLPYECKTKDLKIGDNFSPKDEYEQWLKLKRNNFSIFKLIDNDKGNLIYWVLIDGSSDFERETFGFKRYNYGQVDRRDFSREGDYKATIWVILTLEYIRELNEIKR